MTRFIKKTSGKIGLPPGSLVHVGEKKIDKMRIRVIDYSPDHLEETEVSTIEEIFPYRDNDQVTWINIDGLHDVSAMEKLGKHQYLIQKVEGLMYGMKIRKSGT